MISHVPPQPSDSRRPKGRTLAEFLDKDGRLSIAEKKLLEACAIGEPAQIGQGVPGSRASENVVRSGFLRFLCLGGDESAPVHEHGVLVKGAWVEGEIDLHVTCRIH